MHIRYFPDTDTLSLDFRAEIEAVSDTVDGPDEDFLLHFDEDGRLVSLLIEHASQRTDLANLHSQPQFEKIRDDVKSET